jgi:amino-acid N-acetyltransferase
MRTRKAILPDAPAIYELIQQYTHDGTLLRRSLQEICENVRDFTVVEERGKVIACAALHIYGLGLAEVRSVAVDKNSHGRDAGTKLVNGLIEESKVHDIGRIFCFTRVPEFFAKLGFVTVPHSTMPEKVMKDCLNCSRRDACDEIAMVFDQDGTYIAPRAEEHSPLRVLQ